jgi:CDP-glucose 4,6-dehydratase
MHFLVTGHTGFKGSWLTLLLAHKGHKVSGYALNPEPESLFLNGGVADFLESDFRSDIRDSVAFETAIKASKPDVVIHMAAQPLVRESYRDPVNTVETNVNGTLNVLNASAKSDSIRAQIIVTTDKVYKNKSQRAGYVESDELGGDDPYSASKAMADILTQSWIKSFPKIPTAIARAGNVIGGGDSSKDRLFPDLISAYRAGQPVKLRYPNAVRPWQHVLDCLSGYLALADYLIEGGTDAIWNFGPREDEFMAVRQVAEAVGKMWSIKPAWQPDEGAHLHEADLLALDSKKARLILDWEDKLNFEESLERTSDWYKRVESGTKPLNATLDDIKGFLS